MRAEFSVWLELWLSHFFFPLKSKTAIFAELCSGRACFFKNSNEHLLQSLSGFDFEHLSSYQQNILKVSVINSFKSYVLLSEASRT